MPKGKGARQSSMLGQALKTDIETLQKNGNTDLQQKVSPSVSLTIKVPKNYRQHWQIEAKRRDTNVTKIIIDSLSKELGLPEQ